MLLERLRYRLQNIISKETTTENHSSQSVQLSEFKAQQQDYYFRFWAWKTEKEDKFRELLNCG